MAANLKVINTGMATATNDRQKALDAALAQIDRAFGKGSAMRLGSKETMQVEVISTGSLGLDIALGVGGLPRGRVIEIYGPESSGKTTLALHVIAEAQKTGGTAAFVDAEHALDPVYAKKLGVNIDERRGAAALLRFGDHVERERGLARAFRTVDFDHAAARQAADAECDVEPERAGRDDLDLHGFLGAQTHRRALAEGAVDLRERGVERLLPVVGCGCHAGVDHFQISGHRICSHR